MASVINLNAKTSTIKLDISGLKKKKKNSA